MLTAQKQQKNKAKIQEAERKSNNMEKNFVYEIVKPIGQISKRKTGNLELNIVSWNNKEPKFDIREWEDDHSNMRRGLTFTHEEIEALAKLLQDYLAK